MYVCVYVCTYVRMYVYVYVYVCVCMCTYVYVCVCMCMYVYVCVCMCMYVYVCLCVCICVCIYIYNIHSSYISYTRIRIYTYIYIQTYIEQLPPIGIDMPVLGLGPLWSLSEQRSSDRLHENCLAVGARNVCWVSFSENLGPPNSSDLSSFSILLPEIRGCFMAIPRF